jgi:streptogramin lyase
MDNVASAIKNEHSFKKMIESQIVQLAAVVPPSNKGKIPRQPEDLETANLVDIHNVAFYYTQPSEERWIDYTLPDKKGDPGRLVISISIGRHIF